MTIDQGDTARPPRGAAAAMKATDAAKRPDIRHARAVPDDPNDPRFHMAMCGVGYPWPSSISLEPRRDTPQNLQFRFVTQLVTCRRCVTAIEQRRQPANPIPNHSSDN